MGRAGDAYTNMMQDDKDTLHDLQQEAEAERWKRRACPHRTCPCPRDCRETCQHAMQKK